MFDFSKLYEAGTVREALELKATHPQALYLAGGSDILIKLRDGKLPGAELISIFKLNELRGVCMDTDGTIIIKPLTCFSHVAANEIVQKYIPVLGEAVDTIGGPQIRNMGTIGGNICNGVTSADSASTLFALDAVLEISSAVGTRELPIAEFYTGPGSVDLCGGLLTAIKIPRPSYDGYSGAYIKYAMRNAMDIATLGCSVNVKLSADKTIVEDARIAYGVAAPTPLRCPKAEAAVRGARASQAAEIFSKTAVTEITPRSSWRASKELRMQIAGEIAKRAFAEAVVRAGGDI